MHVCALTNARVQVHIRARGNTNAPACARSLACAIRMCRGLNVCLFAPALVHNRAVPCPCACACAFACKHAHLCIGAHLCAVAIFACGYIPVCARMNMRVRAHLSVRWCACSWLRIRLCACLRMRVLMGVYRDQRARQQHAFTHDVLACARDGPAPQGPMYGARACRGTRP